MQKRSQIIESVSESNQVFTIYDSEYGIHLMKDAMGDYKWTTDWKEAIKFPSEKEAIDRFNKMDSSQRSKHVAVKKVDEALGVMTKNIKLGISKMLQSFGLGVGEKAYIEITDELQKDLIELLKKHNISVL